MRDWWYRSAHSGPDKKFVEVERLAAPAVKRMARAKFVHRVRDDALGTSSVFGRDASFAAKASGLIDAAVLRSDLRCYREANLAKHTEKFEAKTLPKRAPGADVLDGPAAAEDELLPTTSGDHGDDLVSATSGERPTACEANVLPPTLCGDSIPQGKPRTPPRVVAFHC